MRKPTSSNRTPENARRSDGAGRRNDILVRRRERAAYWGFNSPTFRHIVRPANPGEQIPRHDPIEALVFGAGA